MAQAVTVTPDLEGLPYSVEGFLRTVNGKGVPNFPISAVDVDLRSEEPLNTTKTDAGGHYLIKYSPSQFRRAEKGTADLRVSARSPETGEVLASSAILFNAPAAATVDLVLGGKAVLGEPEYDKLLSLIKPVLDSVDPSDLIENADRQDFSFLVGETGADRARLELLAKAHSLAKIGRAESQAVSPVVFYGLFREGFSTDMTALLQHDAQTMIDTLKKAVGENIISLSANVLVLSVERLKGLGIKVAAGVTTEVASPVKAGQALKEVIPDPTPVMHAFSNAKTAEGFWSDIAARPETKDHAKSLNFAVQLGTLTLNHAPLVQHLVKQQAAGQLESFNDLAKFREKDWMEILRTPGIGVPPEIPGDNEQDRATTYARAMSNLVEDTAPTNFLMHRLGDADDATKFQNPLDKKDILTFLKRNTSFNVRGPRISEFVTRSENKDALVGVGNPKALLSNVGAIQRLSAVAPRYGQISPLLNSGIISSQQIARMGSAAFTRKYGEAVGGAREAQQIYDRAEYTHSMAFNMLVNFGSFAAKNPIASLPNYALNLASQPPEGVPDWATLFRSTDMCSCDGCRSMDSPAAYLVDVLHFLKDRTQGTTNAKDVLFKRRPDIGAIELTCENTNTPLPYIDLAIEILENAVSPPIAFVQFGLPSTAATALNQGIVDTIRASFNPPLSPFATVTVVTRDTRWKIDEPNYTFNVEQENSTISVTSRSLQTSGTAAERAALPQYANFGAYAILDQQVYPARLPFSLSWEAVRTYLKYLSVDRSSLMQEFRPPGPPSAQLLPASAIEYLGISVPESSIIKGTTTGQMGSTNPGIWNLWGFRKSTLDPANAIQDPADKLSPIVAGEWKQTLVSRVDIFLQQSELSYADLLNLLEIAPIFDSNFAPAIEVRDGYPPDTCQLKQLQIAGLTLDLHFHRISRFIRLWKRLPEWSMMDLAKVFRALATHPFDITDQFLVDIAHVHLLCSQLGLSVETVASFFQDLETAAYTDHTVGEDVAQPKSQFDRVFNNSTVTGQPELKLPASSTSVPGDFDSHATSITAALSISSNDLKLLIGVDGVVNTTDVSVRNLSIMHRHAVLARALEVEVQDYLLLLKFIDRNPFGNPGATVQFVARTRAVLGSGFSLPELNYLLRHDFNVTSGVHPGESVIATVLDDLRSRLQKIALENTYQPELVDEKGDWVKKKLALLSLDSSIIAQTIGALNESTPYGTLLSPALPAGPTFPRGNDPTYPVSKELQSKLTYDPATLQLSFSGVMTVQERDTLIGAAAQLPQQVKDGVVTLFNAPRSFFTRNLRSFSIPTYSIPLSAVPDGVTIPLLLRQTVYHDPSKALLHAEGALTISQRDALIAGAPDAVAHELYIKAVKALYSLPDTRTVDPGDMFLSSTDVGKLFDSRTDGTEQTSPRKRFAFVLQKLLPYLSRTLSDQSITQVMIENFGIESSLTNFLLDQARLLPSAASLRPVFHATNFIESASKTLPARQLFSQQFKAFELLHKISLVVTRLRLSLVQLKWIFFFRNLPSDPTKGWLDLSSLPLDRRDDATAFFVAWERLRSLVLLRDSIPGGEAILDSIFNGARNTGVTLGSLLKPLEDLHKYSSSDLLFLAGPQGLNLSIPNSFKDEVSLTALLNCLQLIQVIGCSAPNAKLLAQPVPDTTTARVVVQAVKSKYDQSTWDSIARPLRNILREKQRAALVDFLLASQSAIPGHQFWHDSNDLFSYFLIDVEMGPCQLTSRIKQAICSTQLFVQRCISNLEKEVRVDTDADPRWEEWAWMKRQNVHGANLRVLIHPENYMEPELRDDQTDFFKALHSALQQTDLTMESATNAFHGYLQSMDEVSRLQVVSIFHEEEGASNTGLPAVDILHVIARTRIDRPVYYYRQRVNSIMWKGGWMRIDADIEGDHVMPVVWNRKLHLFWGLFTQKQDPAQIRMPGTGDSIAQNQPYFSIGIAWSVLNGDKFSAKRTSSETLLEYDVNMNAKSSITLRCYVQKDGRELQIQFITDSWRVGTFYFTSVNGAPHQLIPAIDFSFELTPYPDTQVYNMSLREIDHEGYGIGGSLDLYGPYQGSGYQKISVLSKNPGRPYELVCPSQDIQYMSQSPFFFQHDERCFFVEPRETDRPPVMIPIDRKIDPSWMDGSSLGKYIDAQTPQIPKLDLPYPNPVKTGGGLKFTPSVAWNQGEMVPKGFNRATAIGAGGAFTPQLSRPIGRSFQLASSVIMDRNRIPLSSDLYQTTLYKFSIAYHPFVKNFVAELSRNGVDGLMQRQVQLQGEDHLTFFDDYGPNRFTVVRDEVGQYAEEFVDFDDGPYAVYNWELFFHIPMLIADRLSKNQKFADAQKWFHYIFDPTDTSTLSSPQRFWRTKKFFETTSDEYANQTLPALFRFLASRGDPGLLAQMTTAELTALKTLEQSVDQWRKDPFKPYLVARMRTTAFQKMVVMKYLDNLIAWGDSLFRGNTIESINEATQIYILAAQILGEMPVEIPSRAIPKVQTFNTLEPQLDAVSNALVPIEDLASNSTYATRSLPPSNSPQAVRPSMLFFCIPRNDKLLGYWDTVADRLFKIRNCMNLQGIVQQLPLFDPPIDPMLLAKAAASGVDISSALSDMNAPLPHHRFSYMLQMARDTCNDLKALGSALLSAMEKKDAESLSILRLKHERSMNDVIKIVKDQQVHEANNNAEALRRGKTTIQFRYDHYASLPFMNDWESVSMKLESTILIGLAIESVMLALAGGMFTIPDFKVSSPFSIGATIGGSFFGKASRLFAAVVARNSTLIKQGSSMASTLGSYHRRRDEWELQKTLATNEMKQMDSQIAAADVRAAIAQQEVKNHENQTQNSKEIDDFMRGKLTNAELYDWTIGQLSKLYFHSYQLAYNVAKRAQRAYCNELGIESADFIQFGYWDSLKQGLLAGEKLSQDLKRMEMAYVDQDVREYEITANISLAQLDPLALMQLREEQSAFFTLPETIFDLSYSGQYMRRIKSVSLTIPCVVGPYTSVNATLSYLKGSTRTSSYLLGGQYARTSPDDPRFTDSFGAFQSIATSTGQNDSGLFEPGNFRDERLLPFERLGAISTWRVQLPSAFQSFDYRAMTDLIIHIRYTAREGGDALRRTVESEIKDKLLAAISLAESQNGLARLISLRHEPNGLYNFFTPQSVPGTPAELSLNLTRSRFPFVFRDAASLTIDKIQLFVFIAPAFRDRYNATTLQFWLLEATSTPPPAGSPNDGPTLALAPWNLGFRTSKDFKRPAGMWKLKGRLGDGSQAMVAEAVEDVMAVAGYKVITTASENNKEAVKNAGAAEVLDYHSPKIFDNLLALGPYKSVFGASETAANQVVIGKLLESQGGGEFLTTMGVRPGVVLPPGVKGFFVQFMDDYLKPENEDYVKWMFWEYLEGGLTSGSLKLGKVNVVGGLGMLQESLDKLQTGEVRGKKLVITPHLDWLALLLQGKTLMPQVNSLLPQVVNSE